MSMFNRNKERDEKMKANLNEFPAAPKCEGEKQQIFNLIILDKSGSMGSIAGAAIMGFNKTIEGIREAQEQNKDTQVQYVSLLPFCACSMNYVYENTPVGEVKELTSREYNPCCCTPLYDAMGLGINRLYKQIKDLPNATAVVTIITDGLENASQEYTGNAIKALVEVLGGHVHPDATLCTDKDASYRKFAKANGNILVQVKGGKGSVKGIYHIQHLNAYHSCLRNFISRFKGVSSKYLNNYLVWNNEIERKGVRLCEKAEHALRQVASAIFEETCRCLSLRPAIPILVKNQS